uniref:V-type proton ATPase subunit G n=1 Tax=Pelusios castaneus TaxID=367368 RepID=A0A8C8VH75_9SAUR
MASQSQGIQQLLQAEKRAAEKVAEARKRKGRRLRQAKEEAQAEVERYRLEQERDFQQKQQAVREGQQLGGLGLAVGGGMRAGGLDPWEGMGVGGRGVGVSAPGWGSGEGCR